MSYKRFKYKDDYICHISVPNVLPSFLCSFLAFHKRRLLMLIGIFFTCNANDTFKVYNNYIFILHYN